MSDFFSEFAHFGISSGVICDGSVGVGGECDAECGEHSDGCDADSVESMGDAFSAHAEIESVGAEVAHHDGDSDGEHGYAGGDHSGSDSFDDDGG